MQAKYIICKQGTLYVSIHVLKPLLPSGVCMQGTNSNMSKTDARSNRYSHVSKDQDTKQVYAS